MPNKKKFQSGQFNLSAGQAILLSKETSLSQSTTLTEGQQKTANQLISTIKAYTEAAEELIQNNYAHFKHLAPEHLKNPGNIIIFYCQDGIIIRYDPKQEEKRMFGITFFDETSLADITPKISDNVIFCHYDDNFTPIASENSPGITLSKINKNTGELSDLLSLKVSCNTVIKKPSTSNPIPLNRPYRPVSIQNSFELNLLGEIIQQDETTSKSKQFLTRTPLSLKVGWDCIEIFPFPDLNLWKPEFSRMWAENDILATVVARQHRNKNYLELDPFVTARKKFNSLLSEYKKLLDSEPKDEETLQKFLKNNPHILSPTHTKMWPKLKLGDKITDFVFQEASGDYLLVEIEPLNHRLFLKNGDTSAKLNHAQNQIVDWKRYIEDYPSTVQQELGLTGISSNPKSLIVMDRSHSLTDKNRRKLITIENESPKTKILTYDDLLENTKKVVESLFGPLWNTSINTEVYYPHK